MPADWRIKVASMIRRVASSQVYKRCGNNLVPLVLDRNIINTDHVPFYRDMIGTYSWSKTGARENHKEECRVQVGTGGGYKDRFTVQF